MQTISVESHQNGNKISIDSLWCASTFIIIFIRCGISLHWHIYCVCVRARSTFHIDSLRLFFLSILYTSVSCKPKKNSSYRIFQMDYTFSSLLRVFCMTNWLLFLMVMLWLCVNIIKYYNTCISNNFFVVLFLCCCSVKFHACVSVCCDNFFSLCAYSHLFRTIWIHITNFKTKQNIF